MKKKSPNWYIAATHLLTAGFVIPFLIGVMSTLLLFALASVTQITWTELQFQIFHTIIHPVVVYLGVIYSARFINKRYIISNSIDIVNASVTYLIVIGVLYRVPFLLKGMSTGLSLNILAFILGAGAFYWASKKYIVTTP